MSSDLPTLIESLAQNARKASLALNAPPPKRKTTPCRPLPGVGIKPQAPPRGKQKDLTAAEENGLPDSMIDRLRLTHERIDAMAQGLRQLIACPIRWVQSWKEDSPKRLGNTKGPSAHRGHRDHLRITANVIDCAGLCLKSGNASILRGGRKRCTQPSPGQDHFQLSPHLPC